MNLTEYLAQAQFARTKNARVSLIVDVDTGRSGQTNYAFRILTPKPVTNVVISNTNYAFVVMNGNPLNPAVKSSVIDVRMQLPEQGAQLCGVSFDLVLDGKALAADSGQTYIFAARQDGPRVPRNLYYDPGNGAPLYPSNHDDDSFSPRVDLHIGNELDDPFSDGAPDDDVWLRSALSFIDVVLVDPGAGSMSTKEVYNTGSFSNE